MALPAPSIRTPAAPHGSANHAAARRVPLPYWLSGGLVILLVVASTAGLFVPGLYRGAPDWVAQTRGTDLVTLAVAVPALIAALILAARGSPRAQVVWLGVLGYILYMYVICAFDVTFNPLFLVYVAATSFAVWALVALLVQVDPARVRACCASGLPRRVVALYLLGVAALFFLAWMKDIIPATMGNTAPASLHGVQLPTNPIHVLDLSTLLPLAALSGIWLWQRRPWGYALAGVLLTTLTIVGASVVSGIAFEYINDPTMSLGAVPLLAVVTLAGLGLLIVYLHNMRPETTAGLH